jgi:hypothetical protein
MALMAAVADYVTALPAHDAAHPLLSRPRNDLRISGSWSVRLNGGGFNVTHSHPMGWISSAFYVSLPKDEAPPSGHFHYGAPPAELGVDLQPYATIAPQRGHVVLSRPRCGTAPCRHRAGKGSTSPLILCPLRVER